MKYLYSLLLILFVTGCTSDEVFTLEEYDDVVPLTGIEAKIAGSSETRADKLTDYVGRSEFVSGDNMVLTTMRRTIQGNVSAIPQFNYTNLEFNHNGGGWKRDESKGKMEIMLLHLRYIGAIQRILIHILDIVRLKS